jgi:hypothetical protein
MKTKWEHLWEHIGNMGGNKILHLKKSSCIVLFYSYCLKSLDAYKIFSKFCSTSFLPRPGLGEP